MSETGLRIELREVALTKRKENRALIWNKNRTNLGEYPRDEQFSVEYINEKAKLLKRKLISLEDYRYLPNALIQVCRNIIQKIIMQFSYLLIINC